ncbi:Endonuclease/exonuclease/phosphatase [Candidatus Rhodobacter oscarellae]|uniref:Endonuclease/exonuclease/phosphatase n=1 Tax=Candidatus Rhodobacter oscarellae TaxID=1675527 RepID=A0A0J9ED99_9RHOB|nr:endonuclease/exonuclease/phosphatase family protein [Candidatus Rhodobacter lobularis]KMW60641.1 Endonuclease/exonuclease/phosphatase [Candidatus Rhodobacter lobularis]
MRIAAYNVENLFDRAAVFNDDSGKHKAVLEEFSELNELFEKPVYSAADKARMITLITSLGMLNRDQGTKKSFTQIRKIRGKLINRPRDRSKPRTIAADGRNDWVGWCELETAAVNETATTLTARVIAETNADILAVIEAESRPVLLDFQKMMKRELGLAKVYRHVMVIDGNDQRGIDVGLGTGSDYPIQEIRSHVDDLDHRGVFLFSRDCPEYVVSTPSGARILVMPNHFKSKFGDQATSDARRLTQAEGVRDIVNARIAEGWEHIVVLGDLNDTPDSAPLAPLLGGTPLRDVSEHSAFTDFEFNATRGGRGIGTYKTGSDSNKIDYILLSPSLFGLVTNAGLFRKGAHTGSDRWETYPELTSKEHQASDHHMIFADINL